MQNHSEFMHISLPLAESADLVVKAAEAGIETAEFAGIKYLQAVYGIFHPLVIEFNNRTVSGVSVTETKEAGK